MKASGPGYEKQPESHWFYNGFANNWAIKVKQ
jgi:hypothetical protein